jgi:uncharacterized protein YbcI
MDLRLRFLAQSNNVGALRGALNSPPVKVQHDATQQSPLARISTRIVQLHKDYYGRGPEKAKTYFQDDLVVVLMRGGFSRVEETLLEEGRGDSVIQQRRDFQDVMRPRFKEVIEEELGRDVAGFMSGTHQHPDLLGEVFILEPESGEFLENAQAGDGVPGG